MGPTILGWPAGVWRPHPAVAEGCAITGAGASQWLLQGAGSPTTTGTAGLCRALPALRHVAAEGLSCYVAVVAAGAAVASLHADEQGQGCHRGSLAHRHRERGPAACGQQRVSPSPQLASGPCQHPAPRDVRTRVGNSSATSTRAGAARCWQPRAPSPARFVTTHFKATERVQEEPVLVTATQRSARSLVPGHPHRAVGRTRGLPVTSLVVPVLQQAQGRAHRSLLGPTAGLLV